MYLATEKKKETQKKKQQKRLTIVVHVFRRHYTRRAIELGNGHVDILINNAGIYPFGLTHETTEAEFDRVFSLNVKAPYFLVAELAPLMAKRGKGAIVNLSTMAADYGAPGMSLYGSSKAAMDLLTKTWTAEYGPSGVRVNTVSPGPTRTEGTDVMGEGLEQLAAQAPAGRPAAADEIAEAIVFLATDRSSFIYGAKLAVDGGPHSYLNHAKFAFSLRSSHAIRHPDS
jgi:NAD(P)-dependent dehydrogenase (short-subunit alcohol dehydrogenase family)